MVSSRRVSGCAVAVFAAGLLAVTGTGSGRAATAASGWTSYDRPAQYAVVVEKHVEV